MISNEKFIGEELLKLYEDRRYFFYHKLFDKELICILFVKVRNVT